MMYHVGSERAVLKYYKRHWEGTVTNEAAASEPACCDLQYNESILITCTTVCDRPPSLFVDSLIPSPSTG